MRSRRSAGESAPRLPRHPGRCTPRYFGLRALLIEARGAARPPSARAPLRPRPRSDRRPRVTAAKFRGGMGPRPGRCASPPRPRFQSFRSSSAPFPARPEPLGGSGGRAPPTPALRTLPSAPCLAQRNGGRAGAGLGVERRWPLSLRWEPCAKDAGLRETRTRNAGRGGEDSNPGPESSMCESSVEIKLAKNVEPKATLPDPANLTGSALH